MQKANPNAAQKNLQALLEGYRGTALIYVAAKLGIADLLKDGAKSSEVLADASGADSRTLCRILRALVAINILAEENAGYFRLTEQGRYLQSEMPGSLKASAILYGEERMPAWCDLAHSAMTGECAFRHVFGVSNWEFRKQHPHLNDLFNSDIRRRTGEFTAAILEVYDFSRFHTIADVGGGYGTLLVEILKASPSARGILFDQPHVVAGAKRYLEESGIAGRCQIAGGDMFENIPEGADLHIIKSILHDWQDAPCLTVLRNCHRALVPRGTLLVLEKILPLRVDQAPEVVLGDIHMLAVTGGRERAEGEYHALLEKAGFRLMRVIKTGCPLSIVEARRI
jgi:hypothetical protein